jgi:hypothetical protein
MNPRFLRSLLAAALVFGMALGLTGCKTGEPENVSARPWNSTEGWQSGFPAALNEGR